MGLFSKFLDIFFVTRCVFCDSILFEGQVCPRCAPSLPRRQLPIEGDGDFGLCVASFDYTGSVRDAILRYKFRKDMCNSRIFGSLLAENVKSELAGRYDVITWVPVSRRRVAERGYDQSELLAMEAAKALGTKPVRTLRKWRHTAANSSLEGKSARVENVRGAFRAENADRFRGKRVLLIDDVYTTGATMSECSRVLRAAGAAEVVCAVIAAAPSAE